MDPFEPFRSAPSGRPFVVAQLGQTLDGRIATRTGDSKWINAPAALDHLHRLRAHVDAVIVGAGTIVADNPRLTVRRCAGQSPARIAIDPSARLPDAMTWLAEDGVRRLVVTSTQADLKPGRAVLARGVEIVRLEPRPDGRIAPRDIVAALAERGFAKFLIEGGAATVSKFISDEAVDRLHVLVAPVIIGSGQAGLVFEPIDRISEALRPATRVFPFADGDVLFDCDLRTATPPRQEA
ncbi:MAG: RibD family protein [Hyphomicrobiaceae bacterium]